MQRIAHARWKGGHLFFRRKVPFDLRERLRRSEIIRSIPALPLSQARRCTRWLWLQTEKLFEMLRGDPTITYDQVINEMAQLRVQFDWTDMMRLAETGSHFDHHGCPPPDADAICLEDHAREFRMALVENKFDAAQHLIMDSGSKLNIDVSPGSANFNILGRAILEVMADSCIRSAKKCRENLGYEETLPVTNPVSFSNTSAPAVVISEDAFASSKAAFDSPNVIADEAQPEAPIEKNPRHAKAQKKALPQRTLDPSTPVSATTELFLHDRKKYQRKKDGRKLKSSFNLWIAFFGDTPVNEWTSAQAAELQRCFLDLPGKYAQSAKWKKIGDLRKIGEAFQKEIDAIDDVDEKQALQAKGTAFVTWNRHLSAFNKYLEWAKRNGLLPQWAENPFDGLFLIVDDDLEVWEGGSEERLMWTEKPLRALLASPLITGSASSHERFKAGTVLDRDGLYWVPLILAHTGMRREEICQLCVKHLVRDEETGIWYFDLKAKKLRLKEKASKRWVVLHSNLLRLRIIESLVEGKDPNALLFPELYASRANGMYGDKLGQKFGEYRKEYDAYRLSLLGEKVIDAYEPIYRLLMDMHSFRTTVATLLISAGVFQAHAEEITGHKSKARKTAFENYDKGRTLLILKEAIERLCLPLDIEAAMKAAGIPV
jgi:integrase